MLRRQLPLFLMSLSATVILLDYYFQVPELTLSAQTLSLWATIIAAFLLVFGIINIAWYQYGIFKRREPKRWYFSGWTIFLMIVLLIYGFAVGGAYSKDFEWYWFHFSSWAYLSTLTVQGLYQVSASYRAFRARSAEAALLMAGAFVAVLAFAPLTARMFPELADIGNWMIMNPAAAANRGITIGAGVGALMLGFRILLGREKHFG